MMAFTVNDFTDLRQLLSTHPEWRVDLRQLVLTDELLGLPGVVRELAEAQRRTEVRVEELAEAQRRTEVRVEELAEAQRRTEVRVEELAEAQRRTEMRVAELAEAQRRTEMRVAELAEAQRRTEEGLTRLEAVVRELAVVLGGHGDVLRRLEEQSARMLTDLGDLRDYRLEQKYAQHAAAYFGKWIRRVRKILPDELDAAAEDRLEEALSHSDLDDFLRSDIVVSGILRKPQAVDKTQVWLVVEVSSMIDQGDVERAWRRAGLARQAGFLAIPVVAGEGLTQGATALAEQKSVAMMLDGRGIGWDDAISAL